MVNADADTHLTMTADDLPSHTVVHVALPGRIYVPRARPLPVRDLGPDFCLPVANCPDSAPRGVGAVASDVVGLPASVVM
jgi:hypothetical protein